VKGFALFVLVLAGLVPTHADTWNVTASCNAQIPFFPPLGCANPANINAVFTTQPEFGNFFDISFGVELTGVTEPVVTNITGTFDGITMTLVPVPQLDWLAGGTPEDVAFMAGGVEYTLWWDGFYFIGTLPQPDINKETLNWNAVESVPEPPLFWMLCNALSLLGLSRWAQMSLRKMSGR
jgi:hypothetical protein